MSGNCNVPYCYETEEHVHHGTLARIEPSLADVHDDIKAIAAGLAELRLGPCAERLALSVVRGHLQAIVRLCERWQDADPAPDPLATAVTMEAHRALEAIELCEQPKESK